jgi:hypothetical protein
MLLKDNLLPKYEALKGDHHGSPKGAEPGLSLFTLIEPCSIRGYTVFTLGLSPDRNKAPQAARGGFHSAASQRRTKKTDPQRSLRLCGELVPSPLYLKKINDVPYPNAMKDEVENGIGYHD